MVILNMAASGSSARSRLPALASVLAALAISCASAPDPVTDFDAALAAKLVEAKTAADAATAPSGSTPSGSTPASTTPAVAVPAKDATAERRARVVDSAKGLLGVKYNAKGVVVNGQAFLIDCIGTIRAAFWGAGIDITQDFYKYSGNGVALLHSSLAAIGALKTGKIPVVGDVVFWDNTWDRNGDGVIGNDPLTHAGIIVQVDEDGTCHYLHASVHAGVTIERMNLNRPGVWKDEAGKVINSGLYLGSYFGNPKNPPKWTAGDLFRAFGDAAKMIEYFGAKE